MPPPPAPIKAKPKVPAAKPKINAAKAKATAARGGFQVQFGAVKSKTKAAREASRISRAHRALLAKLKVVSVRSDLGKKGIYYRLRAGPLKSRAAATALCRKFTALKIRCIVVWP